MQNIIVETITRTEDRLHDQSAVRRNAIRAVFDTAVVWINTFTITENVMSDGTTQFVSEKITSFRREDIKVGDNILGVPVTKIDAEWIEQEKKILGRV
jgi:hypothetical protein